MSIFESLLEILLNVWLATLLTIISIVSLIWKGRDLYKFLLKLTTYETVEQEELDKWLLQNITAEKKVADKQESKKEERCPDCDSLLGQDNREVVVVKDIVGGLLLKMHKECIEKTDRRVFVYDNSFLRKKKTLKVAKLKNLWKLYGSGNELVVKSPRFLFADMILPDGVIHSLLVTREVKPIEGSKKEEVLMKTAAPNVEMLKAYEEGPWGKAHYLHLFDNRSQKDYHLYLVRCDTLAQLYVGTTPPGEFKRRLEAAKRKGSSAWTKREVSEQ